MGERETRAAFVKTMLEAKVALLQSLVGVPFQEPGHRGFLTVAGVSPDGPLIESADNPGETTLVPWDRVDRLIKTIAGSGLGERTRLGWRRKVTGYDVYDWPYLVTITGWSYRDLDSRGISFCMVNPKKGGQESWVV